MNMVFKGKKHSKETRRKINETQWYYSKLFLHEKDQSLAPVFL
ncbi:MAG: hypothetical protein EX285_03820 [Thaumarchaeota archaeon]|nr:hypothetical protein [Nitrososphaerota archaeon]